MSEVKKYDHGIFHKPGDEGSASSEQGKTYSGADDPNGAAPLGGSHEPVHRPGNEGSSELTLRRSDDGYIQGCQNVPPAPLEGYLQGPDPMKTKVAPASNASPTPEMPGAE
jgi:hypothetical protein